MASNEHIAPRRAFLRQLASLPLIGGAVTLIGNPTAAAVASTPALLDRYCAWLANEHAAALIEGGHSRHDDLDAAHFHEHRHHAPMLWFGDAPDVERSVLSARPSSRAALVLSAAGCGWHA